MMNDLIVPLTLTCFQIDAYETLGEQVVAGTVTAVIVGRWCFHREVDETEFFVHRDLRPHTGVAIDGPRVVLPAVVAELTWAGNRVEGPQQLAGAHVERAHETFRVVVRRDGRAFTERRTDDRHVFHDGRRRMPSDLSGLEIDWLPVAEHRADLQIDDAVVAEGADHRAGFRVQLDETIAGGDIQNPLITTAIGPVRKAAPRQLTGRDAGAFPFAQAVLPDFLA